MQTFDFAELSAANLCVDATYRGGRAGGAGDDPLVRLLRVSNMGGFRYRGSLSALDLVVLSTSMSDAEWPDTLDLETGVFTYFGDNKKPGRTLHDTPRNGNVLLRRLFDLSHGGAGRELVPPIFVFANTGEWRDVVFLGLAVPGTADLQSSEDLVAVWKSVDGKRFQNYRARFTILDVSEIQRAWLDDIIAGNAQSVNAPREWTRWLSGGLPNALVANRSLEYRTKVEQLPESAAELRMLKAIHAHFSDRPHDFEACAAIIARMILPDITSLDLTRPSRDGGRDAIGQFRIGRGETSILVGCAIEAKCYGPSNAVGVREMSRLISRLRHRQFGVLVTTSYVDLQTYREIREDGHPVVVVSGGDIVKLLRANGLSSPSAVSDWLDKEFPPQIGGSR